ncbi:MAG: 1-acyl-sn-glycerol-3-phosphate acyltransferase [Lachnospiraceae bacterium]|nr:1-acyl-sn-glycerol-3-phosphate acyltransferase [Lachnospiraceae bacterium]
MLKYILLFFAVYLLSCFLVLNVSAFIVDSDREYDNDSDYYRFLLNSATGLALFCGRMHVEVNGLDKIPEGRFLLVSNHRSKFDPIVTWFTLRKISNISFITKEDNLHVPAFGKIVRRCCFYAIDRKNPRNALKTIQKAAVIAENDVASIGIYPEGTRNHEKEMLPFKPGAFKIATMANIPVVAVALTGTDDEYRNFPFHSTNVSLTVADVIPAEYVSAHRTCDISKRAQKAIENTLKRTNSGGTSNV